MIPAVGGPWHLSPVSIMCLNSVVKTEDPGVAGYSPARHLAVVSLDELLEHSLPVSLSVTSAEEQVLL